MDTSTVLFISGIISCVIGVASFVTGMVSRARNDGKLEAKLSFCLQGIEEIKQSIQNISTKQSLHNTNITECKQDIKRVDEKVNRLEEEFDALRKKVDNYGK